MVLLTGMLGIAGAWTFEKVKGMARQELRGGAAARMGRKACYNAPFRNAQPS